MRFPYASSTADPILSWGIWVSFGQTPCRQSAPCRRSRRWDRQPHRPSSSSLRFALPRLLARRRFFAFDSSSRERTRPSHRHYIASQHRVQCRSRPRPLVRRNVVSRSRRAIEKDCQVREHKIIRGKRLPRTPLPIARQLSFTASFKAPAASLSLTVRAREGRGFALSRNSTYHVFSFRQCCRAIFLLAGEAHGTCLKRNERTIKKQRSEKQNKVKSISVEIVRLGRNVTSIFVDAYINGDEQIYDRDGCKSWAIYFH